VTLAYSLDSSALIGAWQRRLPPDVVPSFWRRLEVEIQAGRVGCSDEVKREIKAKEDDLLEWVRSQNQLVIPTSPGVVVAVRGILQRFPTLADPESTRNRADPFVIALAQVAHATVVTEELPSQKASKVSIPDVCRALEVPCTDVYGFVRAEGWTF
jgi:hypothetical protein